MELLMGSDLTCRRDVRYRDSTDGKNGIRNDEDDQERREMGRRYVMGEGDGGSLW